MKFNAKKPVAASGKGAKSAGKGGKAAPPVQVKPLLTPDQWLDILGGLILAAAAVTILGAVSTNRSGLVGGWLDLLQHAFGLGVFIAPLIMGFVGAYLLLRRFGDRFPRLAFARVVGVVLAFICVLVTLHAFAMMNSDGAKVAAAGGGGGSIGWGILSGLIDTIGGIGAGLVMAILWLVAFMLMSNISSAQLVAWVQDLFSRAQNPAAGNGVIVPPYDGTDDGDFVINFQRPKKKPGRGPVAAPATQQQIEDDDQDIAIDLPPARPVGAMKINSPVRREPGTAPASSERPLKLNPPSGRTGPLSNKMPPPRVIGGGDDVSGDGGHGAALRPPGGATAQPPASLPVQAITSRYSDDRNWQAPNIEELLEQGKDASMLESDIRARAKVIEDTLESFGVPGRITEVNRGPTITQFGVEPGFVTMKGGKQVKVKVSRIAGLADDLALALAAPRIRIEAPVPGRNIVGIEVPNGETALVSLRDVMESEEFEHLARKTKLRIGLGQDVSGRPVVADMTTMPHLLIAGTTGSGKSVCVNSIITALMCYNSPNDLRFIMVDPKRVELTGYNGIPHLIAPVVVDTDKVGAVLNWVVREMDTRYRTFAKFGARNIVDFNTKAAETPNKDAELKKLPYIVVIVDELADLMMLAPDETEKTLVRLAQMARATGIHIIIATQRPSVDVVTGLIKANFPARIAFTVATSIDSRVILDSPGAEKLLGRGDMLVVMPEAPLPMRAQGCFLSDKEISKVVRHWRGQLGGTTAPAGPDPITATLTGPQVPVTGTLDGEQTEVMVAPPSDPFGAPPPTWDEARALSTAAADAGGSSGGDKLYNDAVATVRMNGKASISLLQRRLRIGYTRSARLIEQMEEQGIVGPQTPGSQFREVLNSPLNE